MKKLIRVNKINMKVLNVLNSLGYEVLLSNKGTYENSPKSNLKLPVKTPGR